MDVQAVLGGLGLAAAAFSTLWATGGWSTLRRRSIQQELDLAKELPEASETRRRLTDHADEQITIYLYRIRDQPIKVGRALNFFGLVAFIYAAITIPFPDAPIFVKYIIGILLGVAVVWTYAAFARAAWTKWSRWHHHKLLKEAQHSADTAGAAEGQEAEHS
jgi:hypothetical protein